MKATELAFDPLDLERELGLRSFYEFVRLAWAYKPPGTPFHDGWHIEVICDALQRCYEGDADYRQLAICIPPGHSKSSLVSVLWPVWCWMRDATLGIFGVSFDKTLTYRDASYSLGLIHSDWFTARWGKLVSVDTTAAVGEHTNSRGGFRFSTSVGGAGTGRHPDIVIIDDPQKPKEVSPTTLAAVESYWNNTLRSRERDPRTVRRVLIMQRLAVRDLAGVFESEGGWHFIVLPFRFDPLRAYPKDPRTTKGEILWPARHSEETAQALERMPPRDRAAQLDQRPVPEGGAIIKDEWIKWYDPKDAPRFVQKIQTWDLAFKGTAESDFVAGQVWGVAGANYYFIDGVLERLDFVATLTAITSMCTRYPGSAVLIEDKANGPAVMAALGGAVPGVVPVEPLGGKAARLNAASPLFEGGNVWLPKGHPVAEALALSLVSFPAAPHDDDVDACTQVLNYLHQNFTDYAAVMSKFPRGF